MFQRRGLLKTVSPSTLLAEPPVTEVRIEPSVSEPFKYARTHKFSVKREVGVTFGDVVEEMRIWYAREPSNERVDGEESSRRRSAKASKVQHDRFYTRIEASGVVAEASKWVQAARERVE
jgi:hypothetical protein